MQEMIPYLKKGEWNQGMPAGVKAVCQRLDGSMVNDDEGRGEEGISVSMLLVVILGFITIAEWSAYWQYVQVPVALNVVKHQLQRSSTKLISNRTGVKTEDIIYTCRNCGHTVVRRQQSYDDNYRGRGEEVLSSEDSRRKFWIRRWRRFQRWKLRRRFRWRWRCRLTFLKKINP